MALHTSIATSTTQFWNIADPLWNLFSQRFWFLHVACSFIKVRLSVGSVELWKSMTFNLSEFWSGEEIWQLTFLWYAEAVLNGYHTSPFSKFTEEIYQVAIKSFEIVHWFFRKSLKTHIYYSPGIQVIDHLYFTELLDPIPSHRI